MNPIIQQLPLQPNTSFVVSRFSTPLLETGWHRHTAFELILITEGKGKAFIGKYEGQYTKSDIYLLGSNLPHQFLCEKSPITSALVIHFTADCLGKDFLQIPECNLIKKLLNVSAYGLQLTDNTQHQLQKLIILLETAIDGDRLILLLQCLQTMASSKEYITLTTSELNEANNADQDRIETILKFTIDRFRDSVTLPKIAALACMSVPTFCNYFKRRTQKTYINYLNEIRVGYACKQLIATNKPVIDIGYESGFNTGSHFHRQFLKLKRTTPLQYRKLKSDKKYIHFE